jgi:putative DNA primase/helicase
VASKQNSFVKAKASVPAVVAIDMSPDEASVDVSTAQIAPAGTQGRPDKGRRGQKDMLAECVQGIDLWHDKDRQGYTTLRINDTVQNYALDSKSFREWLSLQYFERFNGAPNAQSVKECIGALHAQAVHKSPMHNPEIRLARWEDSIYFDLCNDSWQAVHITPDDWSIVESTDVPVKFVRRNGMLAHPVPVQLAEGETIWSSLRPLFTPINVKDFSKQQLVVGFLLGCLNPRGPFAIFGFNAEQGSGKSSAAKAMRKLVDDNKSLLRSIPKEERDLFISAQNSRIVAFDNLSGVPDWLSDALCKLSTGAGYSTRELYSDHEETIIEVTRPIILNGIDDFSTKGDFIDRSIFVSLEPIADTQRRTEAELSAWFEEHRPSMSGALFSAVSAILKRLPSLHVEKLPRLADFALWVTAAEEALGWQPGSFIEAFNRNRAESISDALEGSLLVQGLLRLFLPGTEWRGTASELLDKLNWADSNKKDPQLWPKTARALSTGIRRVAPGLRQIGFVVGFKRSNGRREIYIKRPIEQG